MRTLCREANNQHNGDTICNLFRLRSRQRQRHTRALVIIKGRVRVARLAQALPLRARLGVAILESHIGVDVVAALHAHARIRQQLSGFEL